MRRRTIKRAAELVINALPDDAAVVDSTFEGAQNNIETCARQLAEQQRLAAEFEAKKPGSWRARSFAKTVEMWQEKTDKAIAQYNKLAELHGRPAWGEAGH